MDFYCNKLLTLFFCLLLFSLSLLSFNRLVLWAGVFGQMRFKSLSPSLASPTFLNNNNENNNDELARYSWVPGRSKHDVLPAANPTTAAATHPLIC